MDQITSVLNPERKCISDLYSCFIEKYRDTDIEDLFSIQDLHYTGE